MSDEGLNDPLEAASVMLFAARRRERRKETVLMVHCAQDALATIRALGRGAVLLHGVSHEPGL